MNALKLRTQINLLFVFAMFVPMVTATAYSIVYFSGKIQKETIKKISSDLKIADLVYRNSVLEMKNLARKYAQKKTITVLIEYRMGKKLGKDLAKSAPQDGLDMITVVNSSRRVIVRSHAPEKIDDFVPDKPYIKSGLSGAFSAGSEILTYQELEREGMLFSENFSGSDLFFISGSSPVYKAFVGKQTGKKISDAGETAGVVIVRRDLKKSNIEKAVSKILNLDVAFYKGDELIISSADEENGFSPPPKSFAQKIIRENAIFHSAEFERGGHITIGMPLNDFENTPIGVLAVQMDADEYIQTRNTAVTTIVILMMAGLLIAFVIMNIIKKRILVPVQRLRKGTELIGSGEYAPLEVLSGDEIGELTGAFNAMAIKLKSSRAAVEQKIREQKATEKALRKSEKKYRDIFEKASEGIFQSTLDGQILTANKALADIMAYDTPESMMSDVTNLLDIMCADTMKREEFRSTLEKHGSIRNFESRAIAKGNRIIHISVNAHIVYGELGRPDYYEGIIEDITQKKRAEDLKIAKDLAEAATRSKTEFLANMSHEIRTPMNAIVGLTALTLKTELTAKQEDYLRKIQTSSNALLRTINDILDLSKIEAGKLTLEYVDFLLNDIIAGVSNMFSNISAEKGVELSIEIAERVPYALKGDSLRLSQILANLIGNAVKFTSQGKIAVKAALMKKDRNRVHLLFSVADTGIGIPADLLPKLFDSFTQADGTTKRFGGTGLGLSICKKLAELMGGEIWVESEPGVGTVFYFTASFGHGSVVIKNEGTDARDSLRKIMGAKVLLVEDNDINRQVAVEILESAGIKVAKAENGVDAVREVTKHGREKCPFDAVLMDIQMPGMDGYEAAKQIREYENRTSRLKENADAKSHIEPLHIPIIALTAHALQGDRDKCLKAGMDDYITKPLESEDLFSALAKWIKLSGHNAENKRIRGDQPAIAATSANLPDSLPGIDIRYALKRLLGNKTLLLRLLKQFSAHYSDVADEIREALGRDSYRQAVSMIHAVKGASANLSATDLQAASLKLETALRNEEFEDLDNLINSFEKKLKVLVESVNMMENGK